VTFHPTSHDHGPRVAAVIPTYNNAATVAEVVTAARSYIARVIVVNDGSIDATGDILRSLAGVAGVDSALRLIEFPANRGKGAALKAGLESALSEGFTNVITMDADGQHRPEDIPLFLANIAKSPDALWIGDRSIAYEGSKQPLRSRAGRAFGAFWYKFFTDKNIRDTQCGFRSYPLKRVLDLRCLGSGYEYEQEILIRAAWSGIAVASMPVRLYYPPRQAAVSHFRPLRDFLRISKVNSKAALIKIFMPWRAVGISGKGWRRNLLFLLSNAPSPHKAAQSVAMGVFMGLMPVYGFQVLALTALTPMLRLNWPLAFLGVNISFAPLLPFLIAAGVAVGKVTVPLLPFTMPKGFFAYSLAKGGVEWFVGSVVLAVGAGALTYGITYPMFREYSRKKQST
jgi:glycosyltransferase involved in cell wall biosynthesis